MARDQSHGKMFCRSRASNFATNGPNWPEIELFRDFMTVFVTCKVNKDPIKMRAISSEQYFLHYKSIGKMFVTQ